MIDFQAKIEQFKKSPKGKKNPSLLSTGEDMTTPVDDADFVIMPKWFRDLSGIKGIPFGFTVMISGTPDSGKTSSSIEAMRCAQEQDINVILVDTEKKTTKSRLEQWGVDPKRLARVQPEYLEEAYDGIDWWINCIKDQDPDAKILVIFDSVANTPSVKEVETDLDDTLQLGLAAKVNKRGIRRLMPRLRRERVALMLINQTYDNLGSPGKSNAGGKGLDFASALTYQTSRKCWLEKTSQGEKIRIGAQVRWTLYKNHLLVHDVDTRKVGDINITQDGMELVSK